MSKLSRRLSHRQAAGDVDDLVRRRRARLAALRGALASMCEDAGVAPLDEDDTDRMERAGEVDLDARPFGAPLRGLGSAQPAPSERRHVTWPLEARIGQIAVGRALEADRRLLAQLALTPALEEAPLERALFLDTETTGLGGGTGNLAFLVGVAYATPFASPEASEPLRAPSSLRPEPLRAPSSLRPEPPRAPSSLRPEPLRAPSSLRPQGYTLEQLFLRDPADEPAMLERLRRLLEDASAVVSFNGKSFDMPVLRARFVMNGLPPPPERPHLDLLHLVRRVHKGRGWRKTLAIIEREVLGYRRGHDVGGEDVAQRYRHFLRTGDAVGLDEVITHNERDVWSLVALTAFYGEPLDRLAPDELPWVARTVRRSGDLGRAAELAELAVRRGGGVEALRARAEIAKAAREPEKALAAFEAVAAVSNDAFVRLELAKLYEHHARQPARALALVERGVAEDDAARARRHRRLVSKVEKCDRRGA